MEVVHTTCVLQVEPLVHCGLEREGRGGEGRGGEGRGGEGRGGEGRGGEGRGGERDKEGSDYTCMSVFN